MANPDLEGSGQDASDLVDNLTLRTRDLELGANSFARAMTRAFASSVSGGKQFDDVLRSLALRMSNLTVRLAFRPIEQSLSNGIQQILSGLTGVGTSSATSIEAALGAVKPFAAGGVIGAPTYFPLSEGGVGLAGEAGPEAILPLRRGADGRLGVAGGGGTNVSVHIAAADVDSFRHSEAYLTGQIARAVMRGQRSL